jgi:putative transcriptional regulator
MTSRLDIPPASGTHCRESQLDMTPTLKNRVRELRTERGWTQQALAHAVGVSRQSINSIERERYIPSLPLALTFARVFKCSTDDIFLLERKK